MKSLLGLFIVFSGFSAQANSISPLLSVGYEGGGETLVKVIYTDGSTSEINAGQGFMLTGGAIFDLTQTQPHKFELQTTLGWKWATTKRASNAEISWTRFPIDVLSFYRNVEMNYRLGGGITYHFSNDFKATGDASRFSTKFNNALGFVVQGDYFLSEERNIGVGLRATMIKYKANGISANGNSFGIHLTYVWW